MLALLATLGANAQATLTGFNPANGVAGTSVTLTGTNLTGATAVTLNGTAAPGFTVASATSITVPVPVGATTGVFTVTTPAGTATTATSFVVNQPRAGRIVLDGYRESRYGAALALQTNPTQFGNSATGLQASAGGGSELDAAYAYVHGDSLYVFLAGNIENNGNSVEVFFDSQAGGQNVLSTTNPSVDGNGLNSMGGLLFDAGFTADFYLSLKGNANGGVIDGFFASLGTAGAFGIDPAAPSTGRVVPLSLGAGRMGTLAVDQSNTGGVDGSSIYGTAPAAVVTGLEFVLPLSALGATSGSLRIATFVNGGGHGYISNQVLAGLPAGTGNLAGASTVNFASAANAGNQYFTVALPAVAATITSFSPTTGGVGTVVTITGTGFTGATGVSFGGTAATVFTVVSATSITATVPAGASTSTITITTPGGATTSATFFTVTGPPTLTGFTPATGVAGTAVTLSGTNLTGATALTLNGVAVPGYSVNAAGNQATLTIPAGATTGVFNLTTPSGTAATTASFTVNQPRAGRIVVDGYRESRYGAALALQTNPTQFGNSTTGLQASAGGGSELDAAYSYVHGDSLYVFMAGNIENNGNSVDIFFDSQTGGQNVLTNTNPNVDGNGLNVIAGLTFDAGFTADYFLSLKGAQGGGVVDAYFASLGTTGTGLQAATGTSRQVTLDLGNGRTGLLGVDQSNTGGVDGGNVYGTAPAAVVTGLEFVIPLSALGSPTGAVNISAFVNGGGHGYLSNQVLAGLPAGTGNLAGPGGINFASAANTGNQYFTVAIPTAATVTSFSPASGPTGTVVTITGTGFTGATGVSFGGTAATVFTVVSATSITATVPAGAGTGPIGVTTSAGTATSSTAFTVTVSPTVASFSPASGVAGTSVTLTGTNLTGATAVTLNGTAASSFTVASATSLTVTVPTGATTGVFSVTTPNGTATTTASFTVNQPAAGPIVVDGYRETRYGAALALQTNPTQFGNSTTGTQASAGGGSELDAAYAYVHGDSLYVFLAGNIENNGNPVDIFFDSQAGGQNVLTNTNPNVDGNGLNAIAGLTFDAGFTADYFLSLKGAQGGGVVDAYFASLGTTGTGLTAALGTGRQVTLDLGNGRTGLLGVDQSNTGGVSDNSLFGNASAAVVTGLEFVIPLSAIGSPTGAVNVSAFVNGGGHGYLSNQVLGGLPAGTGNLAGPATVNFATLAGNQYFTVAIPAAAAPVVTSFSPGSGAVGTTVTLTGSNFGGATGVSFAGTAATNFVVTSPTSITVTVPLGALAGTISVTTPTGTATSAAGFCVQYAATSTGASRCGTGAVTLAASGGGTAGTYAWYTTATGGTAIAGATGASYTTPALTATTTYYVAIGTGSGATACEGPRTAVEATINAVPATPVITPSNVGAVVTLTSSAATGNQWYFNGSLIPGATNSTYVVSTAAQQGNYTVVTTSAAGCPSAPSAVVNVIILGTKASALASQIVLFPNPTQGRFSLTLPATSGHAARIAVLNGLGQQVLAPMSATGTTVLDLTGLARGVYAVRVQLDGEVVTKRVVLE
jgi:hypothetical protein